MWNDPSKERLSKIPGLYETEQISIEDKIVHLKFFIGGCTWFVFEYDGDDTFFGYAILNNDYQMAETGYISFKELKDICVDGLEIDCVQEQYWDYPTTKEVPEICKGMDWISPNSNPELNKGEYYGYGAT